MRWLISFVVIGLLAFLAWMWVESPNLAAINWNAPQTIGIVAVVVIAVGFLAAMFEPVIGWLVGFLLLGVVGYIAWQLSLEPGLLVLEWQGVEITTTVALGFAVLAVLVLLLAILVQYGGALTKTPSLLGRWSRGRRQRAGLQALSDGLVAIAAGDSETAQAKARTVDEKLSDRPLAMLLNAQAAQLRGDVQAAEKFFGQLRERPSTEFLGTRGLLLQAMKQENWQEALKLAKRAYRLNPKSEWVVTTLYDMQKRAGRWDDAEYTLSKSVAKRGLLSEKEVKAERAEIRYRSSLQSSGVEAIKSAKKALGDRPDYLAAALRLTELHLARSEFRDAAKVIENAWAQNPDAELAALYWKARQCDSPAKKLEAARRLMASKPDHVESRLAVASAAVEAEAWSEARKVLGPLITDETIPPRACVLMAELEEKENGDLARARMWLMRAAGDEHGPIVEEPVPSPMPPDPQSETPASKPTGAAATS